MQAFSLERLCWSQGETHWSLALRKQMGAPGVFVAGRFWNHPGGSSKVLQGIMTSSVGRAQHMPCLWQREGTLCPWMYQAYMYQAYIYIEVGEASPVEFLSEHIPPQPSVESQCQIKLWVHGSQFIKPAQYTRLYSILVVFMAWKLIPCFPCFSAHIKIISTLILILNQSVFYFYIWISSILAMVITY